MDKRIVSGYQRLAETVHAEGGRMLAQLAHPVVACGEGHPQTQLLGPLRGAGIEPLLIGDALRPRRIQDAVADGARVGRETPTPSTRGMAT